MRSVLSIILGGGRGSRLFPLTKSAVQAGRARRRQVPAHRHPDQQLHQQRPPQIYVLTQFLSVSLHRHIANTYKFDMFSRGFVEVLAAQQTNETADWYQGTADAVRQNIAYIERENPDEVLILSGDQLYRMDFRELIETHRGANADVTIAAIPVPEEDTRRVRPVEHGHPGRVTGFVEKPKTAEERAPYYTAGGVDRAPRHPVQRPALPGEHGHLPVQDRRADRDADGQAAGDRLRQGGVPPELQDASRCRPTCSTATGRTWARSAATTSRAWRWPGRTRRSTSSPPTG